MYIDHLISVIVPVYNVEKYLKRCVDSVVNQTYRNLEIILVDDGSPDSSGAMCDDFAKSDSRIKVIHKANGGLSSARNIGIDTSTGEYITFIDSDDWIEPETYEFLYKKIVEYSADVADVDSRVVSDEKPFDKKTGKDTVLEENEILKDYFMSDRYSVCRKLYKRNVIADIRFPVGKVNEDICTNYLFLENAHRLVKSDVIMYHYFKNPDSITGELFRARDFDLLETCDNLVAAAKSKPNVYELAIIKRAVAVYSLLGRYVAYDNEGIPNLNAKVNQLFKELKSNYCMLMKSYIPIKRKILITAMLIFKPNNMKKIRSLIKRG